MADPTNRRKPQRPMEEYSGIRLTSERKPNEPADLILGELVEKKMITFTSPFKSLTVYITIEKKNGDEDEKAVQFTNNTFTTDDEITINSLRALGAFGIGFFEGDLPEGIRKKMEESAKHYQKEPYEEELV